MAFDARAFLGEHICQVKPKDATRCACPCQCCMGLCAMATHPADIQHVPMLCNALTAGEHHKNLTSNVPKAPRPTPDPDPMYAAPPAINDAFDVPWRGPDPLTDARFTYAEVGGDDEIDGQDLRSEEEKARGLVGANATEADPGSETPTPAAPDNPPDPQQAEGGTAHAQSVPDSQPLAPGAPARVAPITNRPPATGGKRDGSK